MELRRADPSARSVEVRRLTRPPSEHRSANVAGHPSISWSVVLDSGLSSVVLALDVQGRLADRWPTDGHVGPVPLVERIRSEEYLGRLSDLANLPYGPDGPRCRVALVEGASPRIIVGGHHAALDGLGLVAVLGSALGVPLGTTARGVGSSQQPRASATHHVRRALEALVTPPRKIASDGGGAATGDHLVRTLVERPLSSAMLVAASTAAVRRWNSRHGAPADRIVVAVGASTDPGHTPAIGRRSAWFRLRVDGDDAAGIRRTIQTRSPEPRESESMMRAARIAGISRALEGRTGSTLLVSNLGRLAQRTAISDIAFFPSAHGRSGVAVGGIVLGERTSVTVRARGSDFSRSAAQELADLVAACAAGQPG